MKVPEKNFSNKIMNKFRKDYKMGLHSDVLYAQRIESTSTSSGIPDLFIMTKYGGLFVELKTIQKTTHKIKYEIGKKRDVDQLGWFKMAIQGGINAVVIVCVGTALRSSTVYLMKSTYSYVDSRAIKLDNKDILNSAIKFLFNNGTTEKH